MAHQYKEPIHVGESVVVDSAGIGGIFWWAQDAVDAASNAKKGHVLVLDGTYGPFDMTGVGGMRVSCVSAKESLTDAEGALFRSDGGDDALDINSGTIEHCGFYSAPSGGAGGYSAISTSGGAWFRIAHNFIIDSDDRGILFASSNGFIYKNTVTGADVDCIQISAPGNNNMINGNYTYGCGSNGILLDSGSDGNIIDGNISDQAITDNGTGNTVGSNEVF
jgi:hypothetical protein